MIPNARDLVLSAKHDAEQQRKNKWKIARMDALEYYKGRSLPYTQSYFDSSLFEKVPASISCLNALVAVLDKPPIMCIKPKP